MASDQCSHCGNDIPLAAERCPHCALPGIFPNVRAAEQAEEWEALNNRYKDALQQVVSRGCQQVAKDFEAAISDSQAVIARSLLEAYRIVSSDKQLYATYYQLVEAGVRLPSGGKWDILREMADGALFPGYKQNVRFAALSLDGYGLSNYGECFLVLHNHMIGHRASVFEENSVIFMEKHKILMSQAHNLPHGYRATWEERAKLCFAKLVDKLHPNTREDAFARIFLKEGKKSEEDSFVEVHIWGPMTIHTLEQVIINQPKRRADRVILKALGEKLSKVGVTINARKEVA
jgi:hypothetical protein